jgi:hypothetical protein
MKTILTAILALLVMGCATKYSLQIDPDGTVKAKSSSYREYAYFNMIYNPETGYFEVVAVGVTDDTSEVVTAALNVTVPYLRGID